MNGQDPPARRSCTLAAMNLLRKLQIEIPILLAPMGGGPGTPRLAAAVSNAGGLGATAGGYLTPQQIRTEAEQFRTLSAKPLNLNLFAGGYTERTTQDPAPVLTLLAPIHDELGLSKPAVPAIPPDPFDAQLEAVLSIAPRVFSFTFGIPSEIAMNELRSAGIVTIGTATTMDEAQSLADAGVDAIVAQGAEAGAHRGTFASRIEDALIPTIELVRSVTARLTVPVIASGGIMTGHDIAAMLFAGASAVQLGTAFLLCPEAGTAPAYRAALRRGRGENTVITRAFSGRAARGLRNRFIDLVAERDECILPFPIQNSLTRPMRGAAAQAHSEYLSLWAGTGVSKIRELPAAELVRELMRELNEMRA